MSPATAISVHYLRRIRRPGAISLWASRATNVLVFAFLPAAWTAWNLHLPGLGWDFRVFYDASNHYLAGASPYPGHTLAALADKQQFVYPAPMAALLVPLAVLPYSLALGIWLTASVAAFAATLRLLGVKDWRCFGALFLLLPVQYSVRLGTLMPILMLLLAVLWRYRERRIVAAVVTAVLAVSKLFLFPLLIWLVVTRRFKTAAIACAVSAGMCVLAWLPLGISNVGAYVSLVHTLSRYEETFSLSVTSLGLASGLSAGHAMLVAVVLGVALIAWAVAVGRSSDFLAFRLALAASFVLSPIVWDHYYVLIIVPLALRWPRLSGVWFLAMWINLDTSAMSNAVPWIALALLVMVVQLDLVSPVRRWASMRVHPRVGRILGVAAIATLLSATAVFARINPGWGASLYPVAGDPSSNGAAFLQTRGADQFCWRVWTDGVAAGPAAIALETSAGHRVQNVFPTTVRKDGQALGCATLAPGLRSRLIARPEGYSIRLTARGNAILAGVLGKP